MSGEAAGPAFTLAVPTAIALGALVALGCGDSSAGGTPADAGPADGRASIADANSGADRVAPLLWVDFSATGCAAGGADEPCQGTAALELRFTAAAPAPIETYRWSFGDGTPNDNSASPLHRFELPGVYDVSLVVAGPGGTASQSRAGFVVAEPAPLGAACDQAEVCAAPLTCVCADADSCPPGLADGFCSRDCSGDADCPAGTHCADLDPSGRGPDQPWARSLCLPSCEDDSACRPDFACRELLSRETDDWIEVCFARGVLGEIGDACVDANREPDDGDCAGGLCLLEGVRGLCSADCENRGCPTGSGCATFNDAGLGVRCLAGCSIEPCDADPWLACQAPGGAGGKGFSIDTGAADPIDPRGYCAPRTCVDPSDCGPDGACTAGFCSAVTAAMNAPMRSMAATASGNAQETKCQTCTMSPTRTAARDRASGGALAQPAPACCGRF